EEGQYLAAILNSDTLQQRVKPLQSVGQFGPRDFDKYVFAIPFPLFDRENEDHRRIAKLGGKAEEVAAAVGLPEDITYRKARPMITKALADDGVAAEIESAVARLLDGAVTTIAAAPG